MSLVLCEGTYWFALEFFFLRHDWKLANFARTNTIRDAPNFSADATIRANYKDDVDDLLLFQNSAYST